MNSTQHDMRPFSSRYGQLNQHVRRSAESKKIVPGAILARSSAASLNHDMHKIGVTLTSATSCARCTRRGSRSRRAQSRAVVVDQRSSFGAKAARAQHGYAL